MSNRSTQNDLLGFLSSRGDKKSPKPSGQIPAAGGRQRADTAPITADDGHGEEETGLVPQGAANIAKAVLKEAKKDLGGFGSEVAGKEVTESDIARAVDRVCSQRRYELSDVARADIIVTLKKDLLGWGVLQPLMDNPEVTDIHCYDHKTVVLQRGKVSEITGLGWPSHEAYVTFIDRVLFRLGKSFSTQQHTVDASFPDGVRICAVHKSVCGARGPFVTIRVPRVYDASLESLIAYQVAPPLIINYLAALIRTCKHTLIVAGETGTGKTTLMRCLGTQFRGDESIVSVEDTPELNYHHPFFRCLQSRPPNTEGKGEVTLQEHIKTTLRMCPSRVILGEMRTPEAAESFLESAQTGHTGMSTVHASNARETLVRLESLLGRAQRGVSMDVIRQQIALAVSLVVWMKRERVTGRVRMAEVIEVGHMSEGQIQVRPMFRLATEGEDPVWEVQSWATFFDEDLEQEGVFLGDAPQFLTLSQ